MPPIVPLTTGEPLVSMLPVLLKPLPLIVYVTAFNVTPGATSTFNPTEPTASEPSSEARSLEQLSSGKAALKANTQTNGTLPSFTTSPDEPRPNFCFMNQSFGWKSSGSRQSVARRLSTVVATHAQRHTGLLSSRKDKTT
jgi:hypothetical protein